MSDLPEPPQWAEWRKLRAEVERKYEAATPMARVSDEKLPLKENTK